MNDSISQLYELSGGGSVAVHKPFGPEQYVAIVDMAGVYPEEGRIARNANRDEFIVILEGSFTITRNGKKDIFKAGDTVRVPNGTLYRIEGTGRSLVVVKDGKDGRTEIIDRPPQW